MFNLSVGCSPIKKADESHINTSMMRCRTNTTKEDLSQAKIYSGVGSQQSITEAINNSKPVVKKDESVDQWDGLMQGLFS